MKYTKYKYWSLILFTALVVSACTGGIDSPIISEPVTDAVDFSGEVCEISSNMSRAGDVEDESVWLDMVYDAWMWNRYIDGVSQKVPINFIIHQQATTTDGDVSNSAVYHLKVGETNRLICADGNPPLNWMSKNARHVFRTWTEPAGVVMTSNCKTGTVDMTQRNLDYEFFVGETTDELSYAEHGLTVGLRFKHLIGKLIIDKVSLIYSDGQVNNNIWSNIWSISFPNMPVSGDFTTGIGNDEDMVVRHNNAHKGVTFRLSGNDEYSQYLKGHSIPFYVLPVSFVDGNDYGKFYVTLGHPGNGEYRIYEGNLKDLVNEDTPDNPLKEIKAGQCLTMRLVLQDDKVNGFLVYVNNWSTAEEQAVKDNPYPGIYSVEDIVNIAHEHTWDEYILIPTDDMVYEITTDEKRIIRLYDNLDLSGYPNVRRIIIPEGYILDGLGHNVTGNPELQFEGNIQNLFVNGRSNGTSVG